MILSSNKICIIYDNVLSVSPQKCPKIIYNISPRWYILRKVELRMNEQQKYEIIKDLVDHGGNKLFMIKFKNSRLD